MYQISRLKKIPNLIHGFSERRDGDMSFRLGSKVEVSKNRESFLRAAGITADNCTAMRVSHGTEVVSIDGKFLGRGMTEIDDGVKADALITNSPNVFLFLLTGDCLPVIFYDERKKFVGLAHLSRINTEEYFIKKVVEAMEKMGSKPENIVAAFGPGILKNSYIFSEDEINVRIPEREKWGNFLICLPDGRIAVDFLGWNARQLRDAGIPEENIEMNGVDTGSDKNFFSHYRSRKTGEKEGRMATVAGFVK